MHIHDKLKYTWTAIHLRNVDIKCLSLTKHFLCLLWDRRHSTTKYCKKQHKTALTRTSISAVTKWLHDASYRSAASVIASIVQYLEQSLFIISYFYFKFTSTYNLILFCCLRRNVEPCCHTHDSRTTTNVYSARPRLVGLALYTVTDNRDCVQRVALGRTIPAVNRKRSLSNTNEGAAVINRKARYSLRFKILTYHTWIRGPR